MNDDPTRRDLSELELRVLRLVDDGATSTQLSRELGLDRRAVAGVLVGVRRALGVSSTREALEVARSLPVWGTRRTT